ncbi:MAG: MoxR family ATPase [Phycisphaerales bacterium]|nr:MAG: MoxR family ATPase [Phycisphaerales bacterium]
MTTFDIKGIAELAKQQAEPFERLTREIGRVIVGQEDMVHKMLIGLLADGHVLLEGVPGLAKTLAVSCLARGIDAKFQRVQFTPDLLPADLTGTQIYRPTDGSFTVKKGPIFANIVLADEVNRAPAKVQSALLEAMQERQVTIGEDTFPLPRPFLVLATQNPIEQEGTYPLPEAQVDRFMLKLLVDYPSKTEEREILERMSRTHVTTEIAPVLSPREIDAAREVIDQIYIDEKVKEYIVTLVTASRDPEQYVPGLGELIAYGASPRATIYLAITARVSAFLAGRGYVVPQDVKDMAHDVLRHRIIVTYEAEAEEKTTDDVVKVLLDHVPVP